jgi:hypothetical protein
MRVIAPIPKQFEDSNGVPYANGRVTVYLHNSTSLAQIYKEAEGGTLAPNPTILDSHGAWNAFVNGGTAYDYVVQDEHDNVIFSYSNVKGSGGDVNIVGDEILEFTKSVSGNDVTFNGSVRNFSIGRDKFKNGHDLIPDSRFLKFTDFAGDVVVSLCDKLQNFLTSGGYVP